MKKDEWQFFRTKNNRIFYHKERLRLLEKQPQKNKQNERPPKCKNRKAKRPSGSAPQSILR